MQSISVEGNGHCCHRPSSNWETNQQSVSRVAISESIGAIYVSRVAVFEARRDLSRSSISQSVALQFSKRIGLRQELYTAVVLNNCTVLLSFDNAVHGSNPTRSEIRPSSIHAIVRLLISCCRSVEQRTSLCCRFFGSI